MVDAIDSTFGALFIGGFITVMYVYRSGVCQLYCHSLVAV